MGKIPGAILIILGIFLLIYGINLFPFKTALAVAVGLVIFVISFLSTEIALYFLIFSMLLSPEIVVAHTPAREVTVRSEDFILLIVIFAWFAKTAVFKELALFKKTPLNRPILFYSLICIISTLIGIYTGRVKISSGILFTLKYIQYFFIYFMVVNNIREIQQVKRFAVAILLTCFIVSFYSVFQIPAGERLTAPFEGEYGEPNTLGGYLVLMLSITMGLLAHSEEWKERLYLAGLAILIMFPFLFSLSRGSWLAVIPMAFIFISLSEKKAFFILIFLIAAIIFPLTAPERVKERVVSTFREEKGFERTERIGRFTFDPSASERIGSFKLAFKKWKEKPILGYGVTGGGLIDSQYFRVMVELGTLGIIAFFYLVYSIFKHVLLIYRDSDDTFSKGISLGLLGGIGAVMGHSIGSATFIIIRIMEPFWFIVGLVMILPKMAESKIINQNAK